MGTYALVNIETLIVENTVLLEESNKSEWMIPDNIIAIEIPVGTFVDIGYSYIDEKFVAPEAPPTPPPTDAEITSTNTVILQRSNQLAALQKSALANRIGTLQDAIDNIDVEGMEEFAATPQEQAEFTKRKAQLVLWKNYAIALGRVTAQPGWALKVTWPTEPKERIDLNVSPTSSVAKSA